VASSLVRDDEPLPREYAINERFQEADERLLGVLYGILVDGRSTGISSPFICTCRVSSSPRMASRQRREVREVSVIMTLDLERVCQCLLFHTLPVYHTSEKRLAQSDMSADRFAATQDWLDPMQDARAQIRS
jgi:hypothetical protein